MYIIIKEQIEIKVGHLYRSHISSILYSCGLDRDSNFHGLNVHSQVVKMSSEQVDSLMNVLDAYVGPSSLSLHRVAADRYELEMRL